MVSLSSPAAGQQTLPQGSNLISGGAITLAEIVPALLGTELGALEIAPAPPPGSTRIVRRSEVLAAIERAGRSARGLEIPRSATIRREAQVLDAGAVLARIERALAEHLAPCEVTSARVGGSVTLPAGEVVASLDLRRPDSNATSVSGAVVLTASGAERRLPIRAAISCPAPAVLPGGQIRLVARIGNVTASAPGEARQPGRIGDVIRVRNVVTHSLLLARIRDERTAEVIQ